MGDLEDSIFKENVYGQWSKHSEYYKSDKHRIERDNDVDEPEEGAEPVDEMASLQDTARDLSSADVPEPIRRQILSKRMKGHQTGVKAVLADYNEHHAMAYHAKIAENNMRQEQLMRIARGAVRQDNPEEVLVAAAMEAAMGKVGSDGEEEDDGLSDEEEDEAFAAFKQLRLDALKAQAACPLFGFLSEVSPDQYLSQVYEEDARVAVCVHLYNNNVEACPLLNRYLESLARESPHIKFLKMNVSQTSQNNGHSCDDYLSAIINIDKAALPMLILHKAGEVTHTLVGAEYEFNTLTFAKEDIGCLIDACLAGEQPA
jgi:hypothetical protein